jgi:hypothetical protein
MKIAAMKIADARRSSVHIFALFQRSQFQRSHFRNDPASGSSQRSYRFTARTSIA